MKLYALLLLLLLAPFTAGLVSVLRADERPNAQAERDARLHARERRTPGALQARELNTYAFLCDGENHQLRALEGSTRLRKLTVWFGAYGYTNADIIFTFERVNEAGEMGSIAKAGWDHYAEPTSAAGQLLTYDFAPDWIEIGDGETLELYYQCNPMDEASQTKKAHLIAFLYYRDSVRP